MGSSSTINTRSGEDFRGAFIGNFRNPLNQQYSLKHQAKPESAKLSDRGAVCDVLDVKRGNEGQGRNLTRLKMVESSKSPSRVSQLGEVRSRSVSLRSSANRTWSVGPVLNLRLFVYETAENQTVQEDYVESSAETSSQSPAPSECGAGCYWYYCWRVEVLYFGVRLLQEVSHPHLQQLRTASSSG